MCTAYKVGPKGHTSENREFEEALDAVLKGNSPRIVRPTHMAPVILPDGTLREMTWGFRRKVPAVKSRTRWQTIVNSREDKLQGRTWSESFRERRCLVPAASFFEWVRGKTGMIPLEFEGTTDGILWIAGIWEEDQERGEVFSIITTEPNALVSPVHDRMPAVLADSQIEPFLAGDLDEFGPSTVFLRYTEAENFLSTKKPAALPQQGELF